jgi:hypothetical protein
MVLWAHARMRTPMGPDLLSQLQERLQHFAPTLSASTLASVLFAHATLAHSLSVSTLDALQARWIEVMPQVRTSNMMSVRV